MSRMLRIIITGGHLTPALAVIEELRKKKNCQFFFLGRKHALEGDAAFSQEYRIITQMGIPFFEITTGRLQRHFTRYSLLSILKIPLGFFQSLFLLLRIKPEVVLSFGGYISLPVALAASFFKIPVVIHEQAVIAGLANKIIARKAEKICVSWPKTLEEFPKDKVILIGNPIRKEIFKSLMAFPSFPRYPIICVSKLQEVARRGIIYITGGSLGSHRLNEAVFEILPLLLRKYFLIHQTGETKTYRDYERLTAFKEKLKPEFAQRYLPLAYLEKEIGWVLKKADLVVSRAGANTITELLALGKPAILIPLSWAGENEQQENAKILFKRGMGEILPDKDLNGKILLEKIDFMIKNIEKYKKNSQNASKLIRLNAAEVLSRIVYEVAEKN